jgi:hypothetical protein
MEQCGSAILQPEALTAGNNVHEKHEKDYHEKHGGETGQDAGVYFGTTTR